MLTQSREGLNKYAQFAHHPTSFVQTIIEGVECSQICSKMP
jgi:hypothetical protein